MTNIISRNRYLKKLIQKKENGLIKVITGVRRCGKSYLLFNLYYDYLVNNGVNPNNIITISLDDDTQIQYRNTEELSTYIRAKITNNEMYYVFIDEVQYAISKDELKAKEEIKLYNVLNGLLKLRNVDIYVTGSNSKLLTKDVLTSFRGRGDEIRVFPLTFKEYKDHSNEDLLSAYMNYQRYGGMPFVANINDEEGKEQYLETLFQEVYFKDILERYTIENEMALTSITNNLCSSIGSLTNPTKIANTISSLTGNKMNYTTVFTYLTYLEESYLFSNALRYDVKGRKYFDTPSKYYCVDVGLRNARLNFRQVEETHIMENIIYNELITRGYSVDVCVVNMSYKDTNNKIHQKNVEIDFVANKGFHRYYIQSAFNISDPEKYQIEERPLHNTMDAFKKIIITKELSKPYYNERGILILSIFDFLLDENSLTI